MDFHIVTDSYSSPIRRFLERRSHLPRGARGTRARARETAKTLELVTPRTWPERGLAIELDDYKLRLFGAVRRGFGLDWPSLTSLPKTSVEADLDSRSVPRPPRTWAGPSLRGLLETADLEPSAISATVFSDGGYFTRFPIHELLHDDGVLAYEVDGEPLTRSEGGPLRLVLGHTHPWRCAKWVRGLQIESEAAD